MTSHIFNALGMWDELLRKRVGDAHSVLAEFES